MFSHKIKLLGRQIPTWLLVLALLASTAGAATGIVLAGQVTGVTTAAVGQALTVTNVSVTGTAGAKVDFLSDDGTKFTAAAEMDTGDDYQVNLALGNASDQELFGEIQIDIPVGITVSISTPTPVDDVSALVRTALGTWKFKLGTTTDTATDLTITVAHADDASPGFYELPVTIKQVAY